ncbi:uncharacterized protein IWZ02DRAFT_439283, partial [Phyllosticta citriasiana]|uniref:uncharacterized protein n=1 Tax=Phyllosticta citriasiana TaxID=595635 RepID=UPI0030FD6C56
MSPLVDHTPLTLSPVAPLEYAVELFGKLRLRYLCLVDTQDASGRLVRVVIKKRVLSVLEGAGADQTIGRRGALNLGKGGFLWCFGLLGRGMSRRKGLL